MAKKTISTDGTLAGNSDDKLPTEKAVKTALTAKVTATTNQVPRVNASGVLVSSAITDDGTTVTCTRKIVQAAPAAAPTIAAAQLALWIDEVGHKLMVTVKYADGTAKSGEVVLT